MNYLINLSRLAVLCGIFALALNFSSCGKKSDTTQENKNTDTALSPVDTSGASIGDWLVIRDMSDPEKLNPTVTNDASAAEIDSYIYEALNTIDEETYAVIPSVAELPEVSDDHLTYTYKLKKNVTWSDGQPLTGEDVIFTLKTIKNPYTDAAA